MMDQMIGLTAMVENVNLHHPSRDSDYLRPEELRELLRLIFYSLLELHELSKEDSNDHEEA